MTHTEITRKLVEGFERLRIENGLTQKEFADILGITLTAYKKMVAGEVLKIDYYYIYRVFMRFRVYGFYMAGISNDDLELFDGIKNLTDSQVNCVKSVVKELNKTRL